MKITANTCTNILEKDKLKQLHILFFFLSGFLLSAQTLTSQLDKQTLALGEAGTFRLRIENLQAKDVQSAPKNELLPFHFEEIKDSIHTEPQLYERIIEFAIFEEGKFTIPALEFKVGGEVMRTVPYEVEVINTAQRGDVINDIMKNKEVSLDIADYWDLYKWYLLAVLALIALIIVIYQLLKYGKQRKDSPVVMTNQTLKQLESLRKKDYIKTEKYRLFYVELLDITRNFIARQYRIPADVLLTDDLIDKMKTSNTISPENEQMLEELFLRGDQVKFAKVIPNRKLMQRDLDDLVSFVKGSAQELEAEQLRNGV